MIIELCWIMYRIILILFLFIGTRANSQKVESIAFHLYTDSLKKGQHNYISVDGKLAGGKWIPLMERDVQLSCNSASFEGNELIIPENFRDKKVTIKAVLRSDPAIWIEKTIWIKQKPDPPLPRKS
jgi:hypothetical protein